MNNRKLLLLPLMAFAFSGCQALSDALTNHTTSASPMPIVMDYQQIDLVKLLDPDHHAQTDAGAAAWATLTPGQQLDLAFAAFHTKYPGEPERKRRDEIQERMLGASISCAANIWLICKP